MLSLDWLQEDLEHLKDRHLYRNFRVLEGLKTTEAKLNGKPVTLFCGNDYLGLSRHPQLMTAAKKAIDEAGVGTASARLISGTTVWHRDLEERIAKFFGKEKAIVFTSGYMANLGTLMSLVNAEDMVILDKLSHASLVDAAQFSKGKVRIFPHKNLDYLEKILKNSGKEKCQTWIVTDSLFSMDGDLAPLPDLIRLKKRYGCYLVLDEAHGTGVYGANGRGVAEHFGLMDQIDIHIGTLSKAVGSFGGFVAGRRPLIEFLINHARPFIFETALPPSICAASERGLDLIEKEVSLRSRLRENVLRLRSQLLGNGASILGDEFSPIIPLMLGEEAKALETARALLEKGFLVPAVRYPTVPRGKSRLRITISAVHSPEQIDSLVQAIKALS